jgi:cell fate (sporulation/competence/biofilm development) regulator YlbF (YheA/YmcA/DUF963 family)
MLSKYETEQSELEVLIKTLQTKIDDAKSKTTNIQSFLKLAEQQGEITELTAETARTFIKKIVAHEVVRKNPKNVRSSPKTQEVHIYLAYIGEFE